MGEQIPLSPLHFQIGCPPPSTSLHFGVEWGPHAHPNKDINNLPNRCFGMSPFMTATNEHPCDCSSNGLCCSKSHLSESTKDPDAQNSGWFSYFLKGSRCQNAQAIQRLPMLSKLCPRTASNSQISLPNQLQSLESSLQSRDCWFG